MTFRVAIDVGGTFTDLCALDEKTGSFTFVKDSTTPSNFANGVVTVVKRSGLRGEQIDRFIGTGSTMVINALTEMKGAKTLLVTTKGFRDVLEIQRSNRTDLYNFRYKKPEPFVPRNLRYEVDERTDYAGNVLAAKRERVESLAIALYNSYANPRHELECYRILGEELEGKIPITMSHQLTREWREYERSNTAVMNAFVQPKVEEYLSTLEGEMASLGVKIKMHVMQSNGGVSTFERGKKTPIYQVESGPIGGVIGAQTLGQVVGVEDIITLDVGGTTAKTSLIDSGKIKINTEYNVGRTQFFSGYPVKVPVVDIVEIGAGGGSIAWVDELGSLKVGPRSAGAEPGPACYAKGGREPTVTDAFVLMGVLDPDYFLGGEIKLEPKLAEEAYGRLAGSLKMKTLEVAMGVVRLATSNMVNAMKLVSVRRGYDPRDFTIVAFGGGGPMFATALAKELGVKRVIVPRIPGVFSAWGMLMTDLRHDYVQTKVVRFNGETLKSLMEILEEMMRNAYTQMDEEGIEKKDVRFEATFDMRYAGQEHTVPTPVPVGGKGGDGDLLSTIGKKFQSLHKKQYDFTLADPLEVVNAHLTALGRVKRPGMTRWAGGVRKGRLTSRMILSEGGRRSVGVYERDGLRARQAIRGPAIIEEPTSTTILRHGDRMNVDKFGNLVIEVR
ncbi:MAG: hydantoinase/oxoprolinase family protein [Thaumarchaeota archaeon]|nr:MAG: hydantoinase/oxoprolinase family protein [Nitrososphaerota archaeon]